MIYVEIKKGGVEGEWDYTGVISSEAVPELEGLGVGYFLEFGHLECKAIFACAHPLAP